MQSSGIPFVSFLLDLRFHTFVHVFVVVASLSARQRCSFHTMINVHNVFLYFLILCIQFKCCSDVCYFTRFKYHEIQRKLYLSYLYFQFLQYEPETILFSLRKITHKNKMSKTYNFSTNSGMCKYCIVCRCFI